MSFAGKRMELAIKMLSDISHIFSYIWKLGKNKNKHKNKIMKTEWELLGR
jgi:hypothetical protein